MLLGRYSQLTKAYQIDKKNVYYKFLCWDTHTNKILVWGYNK